MKKIFKFIELFLYRFFVNPCHLCVREDNCELYNKKGFCGDWGICFYEKKE